MPGEGKGLVRSLDLEKTKNQNNIATRSPSNPALGHPTDGGDTRRPQHHDTPLLSQRATGRITQRVLSKLHLLTSARKSKGSHHHSHAAEDASSKPHQQQQHVWKLLPSQRQRLSEVYHTNHDCIRNFWGVYRLIHECSISISPPLLMEALTSLGVKIGEQESLFLSEDQFLLLIEDIMCDDRHLETYFEDDRKLVELALTSSSAAATTTTSSTAVEPHNNSSPYTTSLNHHHAMPSSPPPAASHVESISVASLSNVLHRYHIDQSSPMTTNATPLPPDRMLPTNSDGGKKSNSLSPLVQQPPFIAAVLSELGTPTNVGDHNGGGAKRKSMSMNGSTGDAPPPGHSSVLLGSSFTSASSIAPTTTTITASKERDVQIPLEYLCATLNRTTIATPDPLIDFRPAGVGKGRSGTCAPAALQNKMRGMSLALQRRSLGLPPPASTAAAVPTATSQGTTCLGAPDATSDSGGQQRSSSNDNVSHHHGGLPALHPTRLRGNNPHHEMTIAPFPMYRRALMSTGDHQQLRRKDSMEALFVDTLQQCHTATTAVLRHARLVAGEGSDADSEFEEEVEILGEDSLARFRQRLQVIADHKLAALRQQRKDRLKQQHDASGGFHSSPRSYPKPWTGTDSSSAAGSPRRLEQQREEERKSCNRMSMKELIHEIEKLSEDEKRCLTPQTRQLVSIALLADEKAAGHVSKGRKSSRVASVMSEGTHGLVGGAALPPLRSPQASKQQDDSAAAKASPVPKQQWDRWTRGGGQGITPSKHGD